MSEKRSLFNEDSEEDDGNSELTINKDYAKRYEEWREAEIKRKLEDKYGNADESLSSSSSDDDEDPEELKAVLSKDFFEVISSLKTKDPKIYNPRVQFFKNEKAKGDLDPLERMRKRKEEKDKPVFLRDYERKLITERGGELSDDESDHEIKLQEVRSQSPSYVEEQRQLKESLKKALQDDSDEESGLLKKKEKTKEEKHKEEEDYIEWLKGERETLPDKETEETLKPLQSLWSDPKLDDGEKFLRDYVLNKRYLDKDDNALDADNLTDDEYQEEYMNEFERKFNFRFEEPDRDFLKRYPRTMEQSLRKKDTRRKEKRDAIKQRKEEEKMRKREELKVLKALKRKEILLKIEKIKAITGNDDLGINPDELEEDFDPEAHDRKMRELFNDDYYEGAEDAEEEDELNLPPLEEELIDDNMNWDEWDGTDKNQDTEETEDVGARNENQDDEGGPYCEDPEFNMDCDYDPIAESIKKEEKVSGRKSAKEKRKLKRQSRFGRLVRKEKPVFDPNDKSFEQYVDEYYGIDCEDFIGDVPCRFKYKSVPANSFGLTIEEILAADDKELNQWASIKKAYTIRSENVEKYEATVYAQKAQNEELKRKILPSLYRHETENNIQEEKEGKKKKKKKGKNKDLGGDADEEDMVDSKSEIESTETSNATELDGVQDSKEKKKKRKREHSDNTNLSACSNDHSILSDPVLSNESVKKGKKKKKKNGTVKEGYSENMSDSTMQRASNTAEDDHQDTSSGTCLSIDVKNKQKNKKKSKGVTCSIIVPEDTSAISMGTGSENVSFKPNTSPSDNSKSHKRKHQDEQSSHQIKKKARKNTDQADGSQKKFKKWNHNKKEYQNQQEEIEISDARLKAYGIHPKKFKNKMKYRPQR